MNKPFLAVWLTAALLTTSPAYAAKKDDFPGRKIYVDIPIIELADLAKQFNNVIIVDIRSRYEYQTLRIKDALHIPVSNIRFGGKIKALRAKTDKPIIFYSNGHTSYESYIGVIRARIARVKHRVYAFDAGIFDWAQAQPGRTALLGQSPIRNSNLISEKEFMAHLLDPAVFSSRVDPSMIILDVRGRLQRGAMGLFVFDEQWASLEDMAKLDRYISQAKREGKTLLIYDNVGQQVRLLMYYLEKKRAKNYYFMRGGAEGYYEMLKRLDF